LEELLRSVGAEIPASKKNFRCPFHDDNNPSSHLKQSKSGVWYFHCYACGIGDDYFSLRARIEGRTVGEILKSENMNQTDIKPQFKAKITPKAPVKTYDSFEQMFDEWRGTNPKILVEEKNPYTNPETGSPELYTIRYVHPASDKKAFLQASTRNGKWVWGGLEGKTPLFNRTRLDASKDVLIVEGEKCVREFTKLGVPDMAATTSAGGANGASKADWSVLAGKACYVWRDNDEPGKLYEDYITKTLLTLTPPVGLYRIRVEELELGKGEDVADYLAKIGGTDNDKRTALDLIFQDAEPLNITRALEDRIKAIESGTFKNIPFLNMPQLSNMSKALMPGTVLTVCGEPGAGKSFWMIEQFWRWFDAQSAKIKLLMLEDDDAFHQARVLAQVAGIADLTDDEFCSDNIKFYKEQFSDNQRFLELFFRNVTCANSKQMTLDEIADWVIEQATKGAEVIGVDPVTAAKVSDKPYIDDQRFLFRVKEILEKTGARLVLITHPRIGQAGKPSLSGMAGGASYPRFSQTVLWLRNFDKPQESNIYGQNYSPVIKHKQQFDIRKCRNGKGQGSSIASELNFQNLRTDELGVITE
jgi:hypothetical protein